MKIYKIIKSEVRRIYLSLFVFLILTNPVGAVVRIENPIQAESFSQLLNKILEILIKLGTPFIVMGIIFTGFMFVKARGKPEELTTAKTALTWTLIGGAILLGAQAISTIIEQTIDNLSV
jgi:uncharacterized membrane protein YdcZ (DUF606 family)